MLAVAEISFGGLLHTRCMFPGRGSGIIVTCGSQALPSVLLLQSLLAGRSLKAFQFVSVCSHFKRQLAELMALLNQLEPHYVRCIKPNPASKPCLLDDAYALHQLKCGGVMEAVRISCAGEAAQQSQLARDVRLCLLSHACARLLVRHPIVTTPTSLLQLVSYCCSCTYVAEHAVPCAAMSSWCAWCAAGYPFRRSFADFLEQFWQLYPAGRQAAASGDAAAAAAACRELLATTGMSEGTDYQVRPGAGCCAAAPTTMWPACKSD
jgi:hypothetical protein